MFRFYFAFPSIDRLKWVGKIGYYFWFLHLNSYQRFGRYRFSIIVISSLRKLYGRIQGNYRNWKHRNWRSMRLSSRFNSRFTKFLLKHNLLISGFRRGKSTIQVAAKLVTEILETLITCFPRSVKSIWQCSTRRSRWVPDTLISLLRHLAIFMNVFLMVV